jgi:hypothetical protein
VLVDQAPLPLASRLCTSPVGERCFEVSELGELLGGEALGDPSTARLYRWDAGHPVATDGPYAETKEHVAGIFLIDVERAEAVATKFAGPGETIERRPTM